MTTISWLTATWEILTASPRLKAAQDEPQALDVAPDAALMAYLKDHPEPMVADSPFDANIRLLVPLVSQGCLVGLLTLGTPRGSRAYSAEELAFLATLADEAAAAARIAQLRLASHSSADNLKPRRGVSSPTSS